MAGPDAQNVALQHQFSGFFPQPFGILARGIGSRDQVGASVLQGSSGSVLGFGRGG